MGSRSTAQLHPGPGGATWPGPGPWWPKRPAGGLSWWPCRSISPVTVRRRWWPPRPSPWTGPLVTEFRELARQLGIILLLGSFPEQAGAGERRLTTPACCIGPQGQILARYRKMHLFDVDAPRGPGPPGVRLHPAGNGSGDWRPCRGPPSSPGWPCATTCASRNFSGPMVSPGCQPLLAARGLHLHHRPGPLGGAASGPGH